MFTLVLKEKLFSIPRDFRFLKDVKLEIYSSLITNQQYTVKSNVCEQTFESFLDSWINNSTPNLSLQNIDEYTVLSEEFDRIKDIIQLFQDKSENVDLLTIQNEKIQNVYTTKLKLQEENQKIYHQIIELIFHNGRIESDFNYPTFKKRIIKDFEYLDPKEQIRFLNLIITTKEFEKNGLIYLLDQNEKNGFCFS